MVLQVADFSEHIQKKLYVVFYDKKSYHHHQIYQ